MHLACTVGGLVSGDWTSEKLSGPASGFDKADILEWARH